ncbi:MAG TPA: ComF family protein [Candidatus Dormibacteraeota bacterium]|nr:ComF family protein [Candidatus Dormibacteraeota bacterium]
MERMFDVAAVLGRLAGALAPRLCAGCGSAAAADVCAACVERMTAMPVPAARRVGERQLRAAFVYAGPAREGVLAAKYRGRHRAMRIVAAVAAERLAPALAAAAPHPVAVVPVPLARRRRRSRGYNQAELAAAALARLPCGGPLDVRLLRRRETPPQVGRPAGARRRNVEGAFVWSGAPFRGAPGVWLVDDVATTGATLEAASAALQRAGAGRIEFVAVCCAL